MRSITAFVIGIFLVASSITTHRAGAQAPATQPVIAGNWQALFVRGGTSLRVIVHVTTTPEGKFAATLDSPDQGAKDIPLSTVIFANNTFHFELTSAAVAFDGEMSRDGSEIIGIWQQGGASYMVFSRQGTDVPAVKPLQRGSMSLAPCAIPTLTREARCGKYEVFEDRKARTGRKIALNVLILPATKPEWSNDPIFFLAGGPGQGAVDVIKQGDFLAALHRTRDLVFVDQRGTGASNPLTCPPIGDPNSLAAVLAERYQPVAVGLCRDELAKKANLKLYTTTIAMDDLDEIRGALGYNRINLFGGSYGTRAAMSYMRQYPDHVRTVTLKGVAPVEAKLPIPFARGVDHALDRMFIDCAADAACAKAYPNVRTEFAAVLKKFDTGPITIKATNPLTRAAEEFPLSRELFMENIRLQLYSPNTVRLLPLLIHQMSGGDFTSFAVVSFQLMQQLPRSIAQGMQLSVLCAEDLPFVTDDVVTKEMKPTMFGAARVATFRAACKDWPVADVQTAFNAPVKSALPVLMISGEADPVTPHWLGADALKTLSNGKQVVIPNGTHLTEDECLFRLIAQFIDQESWKNLDTSCINGIKWLPYAIP